MISVLCMRYRTVHAAVCCLLYKSTMMRAIITPMLVFPATTAFTLKANNLPCKKECRPKTYVQAVDIDLQHAIPLLAATSIGAWWFLGSESRAKQAQYAEWENQQTEYQVERERLAHIEPKDAWTVNELAHYNGEDENGPILMAVKGDVYNVWKGRNFYGLGGEYHIMAGRDATRFLAKNRLDEETEEQLKVELNIAERANLEMWYWTIKNKYQLVGQLEGFDPKSTEM